MTTLSEKENKNQQHSGESTVWTPVEYTDLDKIVGTLLLKKEQKPNVQWNNLKLTKVIINNINILKNNYWSIAFEILLLVWTKIMVSLEKIDSKLITGSRYTKMCQSAYLKGEK